MRQEEFVQYLDNVDAAAAWLESLGVTDIQRAHGNLVGMAQAGVTLDLLGELGAQLAACLPVCSDPDMALNNLERFITSSRNPIGLVSLIERDREALPILLQIFSTSQHLSDILVQDPESYDLLRITDGQPVARQILIDEISSEVSVLPDMDIVMVALRRYKRRETLRIAYGDIVRGQGLEIVTQQISFLADAICEAAFRAAWCELISKRGVPRGPTGEESRMVVLGLGKLGGNELNYSSDIDLMLLYDQHGKTDRSPSTNNQEFFDRLSHLFVKLLTESTDLGSAYRVDLRLRPEGKQGPIVVSLESALHYYDVLGRTWERQAFVKARPVAGDEELGRQLLLQLEPWIYRRYLNRADITGIKALKRRIENRTHREGGDTSNVKTGHGGIRDIEFVIQFLQLLHGGDLPEVRTGNTLKAIQALEQVGCLTIQERTFLENNYRLLRKTEHRLQIMFDLQTHSLPDSEAEFAKLARRAGYTDQLDITAGKKFQNDYRHATEINRKILNHLLVDAFGEEESQPEVDLVLDPNPNENQIQEVLGKYGFANVQEAYQNLDALATERIPFLSTRRCRHFLASIVPHLLATIAVTPDPDFTLVNLARVSDSLGGKGVLWELFSFNTPLLRLYVRLCASSSYLSGILTSNPGMIDELMDYLVLDRFPSQQLLQDNLTDLCRGAEDPETILHSFKAAQHFRVGVRDILGKDDIEATTGALSDIAEVCLCQIIRSEFARLVDKYGEPHTEEKGVQRPCELITLALGKLGGREPNYHSDLDLIFLYEGDGQTVHRPLQAEADTTTNQHFFSELGQRIIHLATRLGPYGRLYDVDVRLRPTGKSGMLAVSLSEFSRYFREGQGQLWERQSLCKARPITGSVLARQRVAKMVYQAITQTPWQNSFAREIKAMRHRMEETATLQNLKRGPGGTVDIEFATQMLQLSLVREDPEILVPGTWTALAKLHERGHLSENLFKFFGDAYRFLRGVEARLRLMNTTARHDLPDTPAELARLAYLLHYDTPEQLEADCVRWTAEVRKRFEQIFAACLRDS